jgi:HEAT repeat protein
VPKVQVDTSNAVEVVDSRGPGTAEQSASLATRDQRIRAEIEALHQARVEQRQRIEARQVGRAENGDLEKTLRPRQTNSLVAAILPGASDISRELHNGLQSTTRAASSRSQTEDAEDFRFITNLFDDPSPDVRNVAARALYHLQSDRAATFTRALREASPERRQRIGAALATSGLATEALTKLGGQDLDEAYDAFSVLFLMAKAGEVQPLIKAIEDGPSLEVRLAVVKLGALSGQAEVVSAFRRLAVRSSLPAEVRSAVMEAIHQIRTQAS